MPRKPIVAGMFYPSNAEKIKDEIKECFLDNKFGPGKLPKAGNEKIIGVIAPHAGYQFSGMGQAWSYSAIAASDSDLFVILGTAHSGFLKAALSTEDFETPLGIVSIDKDFARALITKGIVKEDKNAHSQEHSIEVQLPFLQFVKKEFKILPIVCGEETDYKELGKAIAGYITQLKKKATVICSSDFTHYGMSYAYVPFYEKIKENIESLDGKAISFIENMDSDGFLEYVKKTGATICGAYAIAAWIETCKSLGITQSELIKYYTSGEIVNEYENCVGYASIKTK